jgi:hypothetical protein
MPALADPGNGARVPLDEFLAEEADWWPPAYADGDRLSS